MSGYAQESQWRDIVSDMHADFPDGMPNKPEGSDPCGNVFLRYGGPAGGWHWMVYEWGETWCDREATPDEVIAALMSELADMRKSEQKSRTALRVGESIMAALKEVRDG